MKIIMKKTQKKKSVHSTANRHTVIVLGTGRGRIGNGTDSTAARREIVCNFRLLFCRFFSCYILQTNILFAFIFAFIPHFFLYICSMRAAWMCVSHWTILFIRGIEIHGVFMCLLVVVVALLLRWWHAEQFLAFAEKCYTKLYSLFPYSGRSVKAALWIQQNRKNQT